MSTFDPDVWRKRAWARFRRAHLRGVPKREGEATYAADMYAISDLEKVIGWCSSKKLTVEFVKKAAATYIYHEGTIKVSARLSPARQVVLLLHECGHHLIGMKEHHERFGMGYPMSGDQTWNKTFHHRIACLEEELEAWHRGWKLVQRLCLNVDRELYDAVRLECIRTYVWWTVRPGPKEAE